MQKSGWTPGTALGASSVPIPVSQSTASQVRIRIKDDTLGLGANLKSRDIEGQRTGLDAFQGLLGRLNAKDQKEVQVVEEKIENKKLAMFAMGRWGGMVFVPGGVLVQEDPTKKKQTQSTIISEGEGQKSETPSDNSGNDSDAAQQRSSSKSKSKSKPKSKRTKNPNETPEERAQRKSEKRARKEARLLRKLQKEARRTGTGTGTSTPVSSSEPPTTQPSTTNNTGTSTPVQSSAPSEVNVTSISRTTLKNGRHLLRGRNIQAKKMAFSDARGLDQIFMRRVEGRTEA